MKKRSYLLSFLLLSNSVLATAVSKHFDNIKTDPKALYAFLKVMPKGGELHYHLAGSAYPETMLNIAADDAYCLDTHSFSVQNGECKNLPTSETLLSDQSIYNDYVRAWSMKDFVAGKQSGHDHFFAAFDKFMPIVNNHRSELLAKIIERAANQNEQYLEVMALPDNGKSIAFGKSLNQYKTNQQKLAHLLSSADFVDNIQYTVEQTGKLITQTKSHLGCNKHPNSKACKITVRFQYYTLRELPINNFFAMAVNAFESANRSDKIVGINFVQPEDSPASLRNIKQQMQVFDFLHQQYPQVNIDLHAGEVTPNNVPPAELRYHINDAIKKAHAQRIGHGADIAYENNSADLMKYMANEGIAVEINLTSNHWILGLYGLNHPLNYYLKHQVPIVLSTDDEGILRTDLTTQYVKAVTEHDLNYNQIKTINRNALSYSFLPGKSLWQDNHYKQRVMACTSLESKQCIACVKNNLKAKLQRQLELKLQKFETTQTR